MLSTEVRCRPHISGASLSTEDFLGYIWSPINSHSPTLLFQTKRIFVSAIIQDVLGKIKSSHILLSLYISHTYKSFLLQKFLSPVFL